MRINQSYVVVGIVCAVIALGAGVMFVRSGRFHRNLMISSVKTGLGSLYDRALESGAATGDSQVSPEEMKKLLSDRKRHSILPSFVLDSNVLIPRQTIEVGSSNLFCVIRLNDDRCFGLDARRNFRAVSPTELNSWPHQSLNR